MTPIHPYRVRSLQPIPADRDPAAAEASGLLPHGGAPKKPMVVQP